MSLNLNGVSCGYGKKIVVKNVQCTIERGDVVAILGPNGVGKSTLFKTLLGFIDALEGEILIDGRDLKKLNEKDRAALLAYVPQAKGYSYQYTVEDIVVMGRISRIGYLSSPSQEDINIALDALNSIGILHLKDKNYSELSGGEQQCALIARAIAQGSSFLVMDEPASNLDLKNQKKLLNAVRAFAKKDVGILMATHSPEHVFMVCNKVLLIGRDGSAEFGEVEELMTVERLKTVFDVDLEILQTQTENGIKKAIFLK